MHYTVHGILQARILEWVASPSPADLPDPGIEPGSPALQVDSLPTEPSGKPEINATCFNVGSVSLLLVEVIKTKIDSYSLKELDTTERLNNNNETLKVARNQQSKQWTFFFSFCHKCFLGQKFIEM